MATTLPQSERLLSRLAVKHRYQVYTPFSRGQNLGRLIEMLDPMNVLWHLIAEEKELPMLEALPPTAPWILGRKCPATPEGWHPAGWKINWFLDHTHLAVNDRYVGLGDDDALEPDFLKKLDAVDGEVLICSMKRQSNGDTLIARQENLKEAFISGQQIICTGRILRDHRYGQGVLRGLEIDRVRHRQAHAGLRAGS